MSQPANLQSNKNMTDRPTQHHGPEALRDGLGTFRTLTLPVDCSGDFGPRGLSVQYTQNVRGCPPAHTGCPWLSVSTHRTSVAVRVCLCVSDVRGYPSAHTGRLCVSVSTHRTSVAVRVCPSAHTGRLWLSISTHISTFVLGPSTLTLPVDCLGDFGPRGLSVQYTQDIRGCPPAHTRRPWLSVAVRQHTQDVRGCPCVSISIHRTSVAVHQYTYQHVGPWTQHAGPSCGLFGHKTSVAVCVCPCVSVCVRQHIHDVLGCPSVHISARCTHMMSVGVRQHTLDVRGCPWLSVSTHRMSVAFRVYPCVYAQDVRGCPSAHTGRLWVSVSTHRTSVGVRQHTQDVRGCLCVSVCVRVCPSVHTGRPWLSISTHISTLVLGLSTLTLPVDCSGDFSPRELSVQYTQDVCGCPPAHTGRPWLSVSTHWTSVAVRVCLCVSVSTHRTFAAVHHTHRTYVGVRQQTLDVRGCPWLSVSTHRTSVAVRVCLCVSVSILMTSVAVHQYTYQHVGPWTQHAGPSCGLFGTSVGVRQHTQDVRGCPCVSGCVRVCPSAHTGCLWLSISTHISTLVLGLSTLTLPVDCSADFGPRGLSVQYTQDVHGCLSAHTGRPCVSVSTHRMSVALRVCLSAHTGRLWLSVSTHISTLVLGLSMLALPVDCSGDFGPRGLSFQYTQDVCVCPSAHTGCLWVSVSTHMTSVAFFVFLCVSISTHMTSVAVQHTHRTSVGVRQHTQDVHGCLCVSVSTDRMSAAVHQYTYQHVGPRTQHADPSRGLFGTSVCVRQHTQEVRGCPCVSVSTHMTSVAVHQMSLGVRQRTQDVCVCPSVSVSTHRTSMAVHQYTYPHVGPWTQHTQDVRGCPWLSVAVRVCPCVSVSTHRMSVAVHQYTYQHVGPWTQHAGPSCELFGTSVGVRQHTQDVRGCPCVSVCVRVCPSAHTGRPWLSISTHISTLVLGLSTLTLSMDCSADFGPRGLSVQYTQDVHGCLSAHTGRLWLSVSTHISTLVLGLSTLTLPVECSGDFGPRGLSVQYTQDVRGCPPAHTERPSAHTGRPCLSVAVRQHTHDVCGCPSVHISARYTHRTSVWVHQHTQDVRGTHMTSVAVHQYTYQHVGLWTQHAGPSRRLWVSVSTHRTSVGVRQHTQDVRGCPCVSICVRVCPSAHTGHPWLSISTHISTLVLGLSTLTLPVDCSGDFGPRGLSVQYTQDVHGCLSAHTGRPCVSVRTHRTSVALRVCPCVSISTHRTSVAVRQYTYQHVVHTGRPWLSVQYTQDVSGCPSAHTGRPWLSVCVRVCPSAHTGCLRLSISTHISMLVLGLSTLTLLVDCSGDFRSRGLFVQYTQDVCGCPSAHTGRPCVSVSTHRKSVCVRQHTQEVRGCPCVSVSTHMTSVAVHQMSVGVRQRTQDVCVCPSVSVSTHRTSMAVHQYTYPHVGPWTQHTQDVRGCPWLSVAVRVCPCVSVSTHRMSVAVHQYTYQHVGPWTQHAGPSCELFGMSVGVRQHTQDVRGCPCVSVCVRVCPSAHTGRPWLSISTHISTLVLGLSTLTLSMDCSADFGPRGLSVQYTQDVHGCLSAHTGRLWLSVSTHISTLVLGLSTLTLPVECSGDFGPRGLSVQYTQDVRGCPPAHTERRTHRTSVAVHQYTYQHASPWTQHAGPSRGLFGTHMTSVAVHQYTYQHVGLWTQHAGPSRELFGDVCGCPCVSVFVRQHTQDIRGCPSVHISARCTHRTSVGVRQRTQDICVCPFVSVSTHRTSMAVHQYTYPHVGPWTQHAGHSIGLFGTHMMSVAVHQYTYQHAGPWTQHAGPSRGLFG
ncbi:hypothetical protein YC2023_108609 [Brassica napus]